MPIPRPPLVVTVVTALGAFLVASAALAAFVFPMLASIDAASHGDFTAWQARQQQTQEAREE